MIHPIPIIVFSMDISPNNNIPIRKLKDRQGVSVRDSMHLQTFGHKDVSFTKRDLSNKTVKS